jgi:hypothetical protein
MFSSNTFDSSYNCIVGTICTFMIPRTWSTAAGERRSTRSMQEAAAQWSTASPGWSCTADWRQCCTPCAARAGTLSAGQRCTAGPGWPGRHWWWWARGWWHTSQRGGRRTSGWGCWDRPCCSPVGTSAVALCGTACWARSCSLACNIPFSRYSF